MSSSKKTTGRAALVTIAASLAGLPAVAEAAEPDPIFTATEKASSRLCGHAGQLPPRLGKPTLFRTGNSIAALGLIPAEPTSSIVAAPRCIAHGRNSPERSLNAPFSQYSKNRTDSLQATLALTHSVCFSGATIEERQAYRIPSVGEHTSPLEDAKHVKAAARQSAISPACAARAPARASC